MTSVDVEREHASSGDTPLPRLRWWREVVYIVVFYVVYSFVRNTGAATDSAKRAFENAKDIIAIEKAMGLYVERSIQDAFLDWTWFIRLWNIFYGSFHFVVTAGALVWCFRKMPRRYPKWRNTLAFTTGLALIGFAFFPLMPPRLLHTVDPSYGFVDTLAKIGGLWSFDSGTMKSISNQYAAMPSLHFGWSAWSAFVLWPATERRPFWRVLVVLYPVATLFAIVVTANHFWLDAVGGAVVLAVGYALGSALSAFAASRARSSSSNVAASSS
ncbi:MAG TPA: phosphatase PAP2 family protein [Acidimicrobiales bacterium]|nr:phosphatase PAP2 family protein [Acidimicrobiales bacterium]